MKAVEAPKKMAWSMYFPHRFPGFAVNKECYFQWAWLYVLGGLRQEDCLSPGVWDQSEQQYNINTVRSCLKRKKKITFWQGQELQNIRGNVR
jgi:hypothetical protein